MATRPSAKPAAKAASKTAAPATLTLKHLAAEIADSHELTKKQADQILNDTVALVVQRGGHVDRLPLRRHADACRGTDLRHGCSSNN